MLVHAAIEMGVQVKLEDFAMHTFFNISDYFGRVSDKKAKGNVVQQPDTSFSQLKALTGKTKW